MKIAFFDSGIGGLTVLKNAIEEMPNTDFIYYADIKNVPYGTKPREEVRRYIFEAVDFIAKQDIKALVVACNTATSVAISDLRKMYDFPILGMEPAVKPAIVKNYGKKILVLATSLTLKESKLESLIKSLDKTNKTVKMEMDMLVRFAESFDFSSPVVHAYIQDKLCSLRLDNFETIVLGCTHFIYYKQIIQKIAGNGIEVLDGNIGTINNLKRCLSETEFKNDNHTGEIIFYLSGKKVDQEQKNKLLEVMEYGSSSN
jgi:glutamate racemase